MSYKFDKNLFDLHLNENIHIIHKYYTKLHHAASESMIKHPEKYTKDQHALMSLHHLDLARNHNKEHNNLLSKKDDLYHDDAMKHKNIASFHDNRFNNFRKIIKKGQYKKG